ncbi:uncharacterized protein N7482_006950 [Penicillium canariense]|uniref:Uncharacterized protein n=1 Tax=Penicillium canariense TaxID=189055 RepID=A0A9W9LK45_9EURO|nr:uncharacterized protein N7482_006950 [Penicillium canariense]KAJ5159946.1 hypothetical protein N7482_006950 [Penicillium canariense]
MGKDKQKEDLCAIFVHGGAGYHSRENESKHLEACQQAAKAGMTFLRNGGTAVDAVEVALMVLEDAPITNAGYGSNLNVKGIVEGDASIVDHLGRSGACGAVPTVKNPIMLARKIYDQAHKSPGMSRVPPNLLVGEGAADFAWNNGVILVPDEALITPASKARYDAWCKEIAEWEAENPKDPEQGPVNAWLRRPLTPISTRIAQMDMAAQAEIKEEMPTIGGFSSDFDDPAQLKNGKSMDGPPLKGYCAPASPRTSTSSINASMSMGRSAPAGGSGSSLPTKGPEEGKDLITDTVGAIAVDMFGNIAAGSSSGGIGMKHRGRVGPAALIGIGTHVMPIDPTDPEETSVAAVTSGTGEHIASTFAASTCSSRVYYSQRMDHAGSFNNVTEEEAISAMITKEFTGHPAVSNSEISGSIGIMCVKKNVDGIVLYFAHNTESFAIASMSNYQSSPSCLMSRNVRRGPVAQGATKFRPKESKDKAKDDERDTDKKKKRKADRVS